MTRGTAGRGWKAGGLALAVGLTALAVPPLGVRPTWDALLAPYSTGAPLPGGFQIEDIHRGPDNGVVIAVRRPADGAAVEVIVVERGRWQSRYESASFTIDYELPRSPAAERDGITALIADTIRSRDRGLPAPDAVPLRADDTSVVPWWLAMLRGARGMLVGSSLTLLVVLLLLRSPGVGLVAVALGTADVAARLIDTSWPRVDVGAVWVLPTAAGLLLAARWHRRSRPATPGGPLWVVALVALVARLGLGPWGPLHVNGHGPRFVAGAARDPADIAAYGPGYHEIFAPLAALAPSSPDWAIFGANAVFSALVAPLAFAIGRMTGLTTRAAFAAALLLAVDPVAIRMGATEAYFAAIAFFCTAGAAAMLGAERELEAGGRRPGAGLLVAAGLLLAQAARMHPCAWVLMATVPFVLAAGSAGPWRQRLAIGLAAAAVCGGVLLFTSANAVLDVLGNIRTGTVFRPPLPSPWPVGWVALAAVAYAALVPRCWLAVPAGVAVAAMLLTRHAFDASWIWQHAYFRLYLALPVIAALASVPPAWLRRRFLVVPAVAILGLVWIGVGWPIVADRTTEHREYRWVRDAVRQLPPECRVVHLAFAGNRVLLLPTYAGPARPAVAMHARRPQTIDAALAPTACLYYVHGSLCSTAEGGPECDAIERRLTLGPIVRASLTAPRAIETFGHDSDTVEIWIARVERVEG